MSLTWMIFRAFPAGYWLLYVTRLLEMATFCLCLHPFPGKSSFFVHVLKTSYTEVCYIIIVFHLSGMKRWEFKTTIAQFVTVIIVKDKYNVVTKLQRLSLQRDSLICSENVWFVMRNRFLSSSFRYLIDYRNNFRVIRSFLQLPQNKQTKRTCSVGFFWQKLEINKLVAGYEGDGPNSNSKWNLENNCTLHTWK